MISDDLPDFATGFHFEVYEDEMGRPEPSSYQHAGYTYENCPICRLRYIVAKTARLSSKCCGRLKCMEQVDAGRDTAGTT